MDGPVKYNLGGVDVYLGILGDPHVRGFLTFEGEKYRPLTPTEDAAVRDAIGKERIH